ncbi:MAG: lytic murein transglycosylase B [Proteobacteria bacterium]|jgi:membrane-bound lytic murein transglycosylase B|nr:lytic murein transglycosylase B [Pseudomonadota bacterium]
MLFLWFSLTTAMAEPWAEVAQTAEMTVDEVKALVDGVPKRQSVLDRMATPWEHQPWYKYAPIFLNEERVQGGVAFWRTHEETLNAAAEKTGVPPHIVVSIIGVETKYGTKMGNDPIVEALYTLGFYHPKRGAFFRKELGHFLRLATDEGWPIKEPLGSYAGAMGMGQFMPSSYRNYAVDGDGDGGRDLFASPADAIASVANYFQEFGWQTGEDILLEAQGGPAVLQGLVSKGLKPTQTYGELKKAGLQVQRPPPDEAGAKLFSFTVDGGTEYRLGLTNFYVVTRYNHSSLYARAVSDLASELRLARNKADLENEPSD